MDRIILSKVLERNEPEFGHITRRDFRRRTKYFEPGVGHIVNAIWIARDAIASGDDSQIHRAAQLCPGYERHGREIIAKFRAELEELQGQAQTRAVKRKGDQARRAALTAEKDAFLAPYKAEYQKQRATGKAAPMARAAVMKLLEADVRAGKRIPGLKGLLPDPRTARGWFPAK